MVDSVQLCDGAVWMGGGSSVPTGVYGTTLLLYKGVVDHAYVGDTEQDTETQAKGHFTR